MVAQAKVAWVRRFPEIGQVAGMGVQFLALKETERAAILLWLGR